MEWFYEKDHEAEGPLSEVELNALRDEGTVTPETLVWAYGLKNWERYEDAMVLLDEGGKSSGKKPPLTPQQRLEKFPTAHLLSASAFVLSILVLLPTLLVGVIALVPAVFAMFRVSTMQGHIRKREWKQAIRSSRMAKSSACVSILFSCFIIGFFVFWFFAQGNWNHQYRDMASRVKSDMRTISTAIESYAVDHSDYPDTLSQLTTPLAYISSIPHDPFTRKAIIYYPYNRNEKGYDMSYILWSPGTDGDMDLNPAELPDMLRVNKDWIYVDRAKYEYSATNGNKSDGDIFYIGGWD